MTKSNKKQPPEPAEPGGFAVLTDYLLRKDDELLRLRDVEIELKVSRITLFRWIKSGELQAVKVGAQWRVRRSVVEEKKGARA